MTGLSSVEGLPRLLSLLSPPPLRLPWYRVSLRGRQRTRYKVISNLDAIAPLLSRNISNCPERGHRSRHQVPSSVLLTPASRTATPFTCTSPPRWYCVFLPQQPLERRLRGTQNCCSTESKALTKRPNGIDMLLL